MDEISRGAVTAVWHDSREVADRWFTLISNDYQALQEDGSELDWDHFKERLVNDAAAEAFASETVAGFVAYVEAYSSAPMSTVGELADPNEHDAVLAEYDRALAEAYAQAEAAPAEDEPLDEAAWAEYLERWQGQWDGREETWPAFRAWFEQSAPPEFATAVAGLLEYVDAQDDIRGTMAAYGVVAAEQPGDEEPGDEEPAAEEVEAAEVEAAEEEVDLTGLAELFELPPEADAAVGVLLEDVVLPALESVIEEVPEAAGISEERMRELMEQVLAEELAEASDTAQA